MSNFIDRMGPGERAVYENKPGWLSPRTAEVIPPVAPKRAPLRYGYEATIGATYEVVPATEDPLWHTDHRALVGQRGLCQHFGEGFVVLDLRLGIWTLPAGACVPV